MAVSEFLESYFNADLADRISVRRAGPRDCDALVAIVNQAIASRMTMDDHPKTREDGRRWLAAHDDRYAMFVAEDEKGAVVGFASLNRHMPDHDACSGVAAIWIFLATGAQRRGLGTLLLGELERHARGHGFHKLVTRTFPSNRASRQLLRRYGFRVVGVYKHDALIDDTFIDVMLLEKLFSPGHYRLGNPGPAE